MNGGGQMDRWEEEKEKTGGHVTASLLRCTWDGGRF